MEEVYQAAEVMQFRFESNHSVIVSRNLMVTCLRNPSAAKIFVINEISVFSPEKKKCPEWNEFFLLKVNKPINKPIRNREIF